MTSLPRLLTANANGSLVYSVAQARLDRVALPTDAWFQAAMSWQGRLKDPEAWPAPELAARIAGLSADLETLRAELKNPPPEWDGDHWKAMDDRAQGWAGQLHALREALRQRQLPSPD